MVVTPKQSGTTRRRDAAATRQGLLDAARNLFGSRGFEGTSLRDIGELAGVDASLIARYFGNKVDLYIAALEADRLESGLTTENASLEGIARRIVTKVDQHGLGPLMQAILQPETDPAIRLRALEYLKTYLVEPLTERAREKGILNPELHAEMTIAALTGIVYMRAGRDLPAITAASPDEVIAGIMGAFDPDR
jgi:AcrR family transcriptional regulator